MQKYLKALSRTDISHWLVHFTKESEQQILPIDTLCEILTVGKILASKVAPITTYCKEGAACFTEVPPQNWKEFINTNPSGFRGYGIIVSKSIFWYFGGRPAIYTEAPTKCWPEKERYRLIRTDLNLTPQPIDWMHEREWRFPGDFNFYKKVNGGIVWWWPCVETIKDSQLIFRKFKNVNMIFVIELGKILNREEIIIW